MNKEFNEDEFNEKEAIETMKKKLRALFEEEANNIADDHEHNIKYKLTQLNVVLNFMNFLTHYEEHIQVLNKYVRENKWNSKNQKTNEEADERGDE